MTETHALGDFIPENMRYLIIGSFTAKSFDSDPNYDFYYSSKRNQFWKIFERLYDVSLPDRKSKEELCRKLKLGITDIIYQCERKDGNSLDQNLINIVYNPKLRAIIIKYHPEKILFTSRYVEKHFKKAFKDILTASSRYKMCHITLTITQIC